jgi:hypothetical protein
MGKDGSKPESQLRVLFFVWIYKITEKSSRICSKKEHEQKGLGAKVRRT